MLDNHDKAFYQQRSGTFDRVIALVDARIAAAAPAIVLRYDDLSPDSLNQGMEKEVWSLFLTGIRHLKSGAPDGQPGSMTEALSRMSLRSSTFAAALQIKPPQFEQLYFSVDYTTGHEAALFFSIRLVEAAEGDLSKSRQIIQQKMSVEKPAAAFGAAADKDDVQALKRQMAFSFNVLAETYSRLCGEFKETLLNIAPPARTPPGQGFEF